mgnify:FL=1
MNYTSLKTNIQDICETSFSDDQLALFTQQAEQRIYNMVHIAAMRNVDSSSLTAGNELYTTPDGYLYTYSLAIVNNDTQTFLLNKDVNFLREAYPVTTTAKRGLPKFYAYHSTSGNKIKFMFSPIPDANYTLEHIYAKYPTSIVTAGGTYLGDNFDSALLNAALVEAARFQKSEPDIIQNYDKMFLDSISLLKNTADGKLTQDYYRSGQPRADVR